jgi:hypothetical protein
MSEKNPLPVSCPCRQFLPWSVHSGIYGREVKGEGIIASFASNPAKLVEVVELALRPLRGLCGRLAVPIAESLKLALPVRGIHHAEVVFRFPARFHELHKQGVRLGIYHIARWHPIIGDGDAFEEGDGFR